MPEKDFFLIVIFSVVMTLWLTRSVMARVARRRTSRRIEQDLAAYLRKAMQKNGAE